MDINYLPFSQRRKLPKHERRFLIYEIFYLCETDSTFRSEINYLSPSHDLKKDGINQTVMQKILQRKFQTREINRKDLKEIFKTLENLRLIKVTHKALGGREVFYWITKKGCEVFRNMREDPFIKGIFLQRK